MHLTVLGSGAACPPAGRNASGYLVRENGQTILLDCGHGVASAALVHHPNLDIDHIIISHMHADHFIDAMVLRFRLTRDMTGIPANQRRLTLHLPPGGLATMQTILEAVHFPRDFFETTFDVREYGPDRSTDLGGLCARFATAEHYIPAWAIRLEGDHSLTYTGDTAPTAPVVELARGTDLFVCEATLEAPETGAVKGHCTPQQAAEMAAEAQVKGLLLTHFWFGMDRQAAARNAAQHYHGPIHVADDGMTLDL